MATSTTPPFEELLEALRAIEKALKDPKSRALSTEVPANVAANHLDYLAIRELMGRDRRPPDPATSLVFAASRTRRGNTNFSTIRIYTAPAEATQLAVFATAGPATEIVALPDGGVDKTSGEEFVDVDLSVVTNDRPIIRLELLREDGYPLRLGPRLAAV
ncbi:hypothetical protein EV644_104197 [Kribbella orskensis]|uniref:Uncharacterized protein n=1 Tax=Kribbella orskensis TaxID=2512216 RepID=A0ABY2BMQ4_9ACTN|nr:MULTISPECIES: hypothetical protein [Kribbella]TCN41815.1 hypothetical protein EV642_103197 [Kribbella sp. VKM Ac-2500]TCO25693.1 hypothetical protein EV644_104197 [Kribbella orskensis]